MNAQRTIDGLIAEIDALLAAANDEMVARIQGMRWRDRASPYRKVVNIVPTPQAVEAFGDFTRTSCEYPWGG